MDMSPEKLADAYRLMKTIREFEERMRSEYQQGKLPGFIHIYRNQEAIAVAACLDMTNEDYIASTHRGHGHCIAKGCEIELPSSQKLVNKRIQFFMYPTSKK